MNLTKEYKKNNRVELHYSSKDGECFSMFGDVSGIRYAFDQGHSAIAIVDRCSVRIFPNAARTAKRILSENLETGQGIKVIWGVELDFYSNEDAGYAHLVKRNESFNTYSAVLLAKNSIGLKNINRIMSHYLIAQGNNCMITRSAIEWLRDGLLIGASAENGEISQAIASGKTTRSLKKIASFYDYLEIKEYPDAFEMSEHKQDAKRKDIQKTNMRVVKIGDSVKLPIVAVAPITSDDDSQNELIRTTEEMLDDFAYLGVRAQEVVISNPNALASQIEEMSPIPEGQFYPTVKDAEIKLKELCYKKAKTIYGVSLPETVRMRLERELDNINKCGEASIYYLNREIVDRALNEGNPVAYRSFIGASLAAYLCGLTQVNPLPPHYVCPKCKKYYECDVEPRIVGVDLPDRICPDCNSSMLKYGFNIPGECLYGIRGDKRSDIDIVVPTDYSNKEKDVITDLLKGCMPIRAGKVIEANNDCSDNTKEYTTVMDEYGVFVIPPLKDIEDFTPFQYGYFEDGNRTTITHQDWRNLDLALLKIDVIGDKTLQILKDLTERTGIESADIPLNDGHVIYALSSHEALGIHDSQYILNGCSYGIPDFDNDTFRDVVSCIKPGTISDLIKCYGLSWGTETWNDDIRSLILSGKADIGSVISSREDILTYLCNKGIFYEDAYMIMELARKNRGISKTLIEEMRCANIPEWWIESMQNSKYYSTRSMDVVRTITGVELAWFKVNFPSEFYSVWLINNGYYHSHSTELNKLDSISLAKRIADIRKSDKLSTEAARNEELDTYQVLYEMRERGL